MRYIKADEILPKELLESIQEYVDGKSIYIPRKADNRQQWGCGTSYKEELHCRNEAIRAEARTGSGRRELAEKYHLSFFDTFEEKKLRIPSLSHA